MAISKIASAGITADFDNTLTAADIATNAIGISELDNTATGIATDYHKVPTFADDSARDAAIGSPTVGMIIYNTASNALQQYNGVWSTIAPAPNITSVSGFLNNDTDSTLTIFGSNLVHLVQLRCLMQLQEEVRLDQMQPQLLIQIQNLLLYSVQDQLVLQEVQLI